MSDPFSRMRSDAIVDALLDLKYALVAVDTLRPVEGDKVAKFYWQSIADAVQDLRDVLATTDHVGAFIRSADQRRLADLLNELVVLNNLDDPQNAIVGPPDPTHLKVLRKCIWSLAPVEPRPTGDKPTLDPDELRKQAETQRAADQSKRRGRKKADYPEVQKEARLAADWRQARDKGVRKAEFAKDQGMKQKELDRLLDRVAARKKGASK